MKAIQIEAFGNPARSSKPSISRRRCGVGDTSPMNLMNLPVPKRSAGVLWRNEPQADGRAPRASFIFKKQTIRGPSGFFTGISQAKPDELTRCSIIWRALIALGHDLGPGCRHLRVRTKSRQRSRRRRQSGGSWLFTAEDVMCLRVDLIQGRSLPRLQEDEVTRADCGVSTDGFTEGGCSDG